MVTPGLHRPATMEETGQKEGRGLTPDLPPGHSAVLQFCDRSLQSCRELEGCRVPQLAPLVKGFRTLPWSNSKKLTAGQLCEVYLSGPVYHKALPSPVISPNPSHGSGPPTLCQRSSQGQAVCCHESSSEEELVLSTPFTAAMNTERHPDQIEIS